MTTIEQQTAYKIIGNRFFENINLGYMAGRNFRQQINPTEDYLHLDDVLEQAAHYTAVNLEREKDYKMVYPYSRSLDIFAGEVAGKVFTPVAFVVGLLYTPIK